MSRILCLLFVFGASDSISCAQTKSKPLIDKLRNPSAISVGPDGRIYVAVGGGVMDADSAIVAVCANKLIPFGSNFENIQSLAWHQQWLFVSDGDRIWKMDLKGKKEKFVTATPFPAKRRTVNQLTVDPESGNLYVSDWDNFGKTSQLYRITPKGNVTAVTAPGSLFLAHRLLLDGASHLLVAEWGKIVRVNLTNGQQEKVADIDASGMAWDMHGRLFISEPNGKLRVIPRPGATPVFLDKGLRSANNICFDGIRKAIVVTDARAGSIHAIPAQVPGQPVDETPLPLETAVAFPNLKWTGWQGETDAGKINPLRPIVLTHAGDGSNRVFVATQHGVIHVFQNDQKAKQTRVFLDIEKQVRYQDKENEEGFLGLTFHPDYKKTGEFFAFYTPKNQKLVNVVSRFRVSKDDPDKADPASEEIIFSVKRPFWNHDGGTICFGPDGYLYIALGDGGAANDPFNNGQNLKQPLGKILRIDINKKDPGKNYAIPPDNPFVGKKDAIPETWAYGLRNVWRMAFDKKTGQLWAGEVGQNLYEEINIIVKGGNYGWKLRESLHPFGASGVAQRPDLIDPIWEYHHDIGKSITGGHVYRGKMLPELEGHYLYGDYVSNKIWALRYDEIEKRVVANRPIRDKGQPILSFGEDEQGEVYLLTYSAAGRGIYNFVRTNSKK